MPASRKLPATAARAYQEALEAMVMHFGYRSVKKGRPVIHTGGLSSLEEAFEALGWADPHELPEEGYTCEIEGCMVEPSAGTPWGSRYLRLCSKHYQQCVKGEPCPPMKSYV